MLSRRFRNEVLDDLQQAQNALKRKEDTLHRLKTEKQPFAVAPLIEKNKRERVELEEKIQELEQKLKDIDCGKYEDTLKEAMKQNSKEAALKAEKTKEKKSKTQNLFNKTFVKQKPRSPWRPSYQNDHRDYNYFLKVVDSLPEDKADKLKRMTNNTGFIWRGTWFMGEQPERKGDGNEVIMHEKRGDKYLLHKYVYSSDGGGEHFIYQKGERGRKTLLERRPFRDVFNYRPGDLSDFIAKKKLRIEECP